MSEGEVRPWFTTLTLDAGASFLVERGAKYLCSAATNPLGTFQLLAHPGRPTPGGCLEDYFRHHQKTVQLRAGVANPEPDGRPFRLYRRLRIQPGALDGKVHVSPSLKSKPALVVVLHGCTQTAVGYDAGSGWTRLADEHGFVALFPQQRHANNPNCVLTGSTR